MLRRSFLQVALAICSLIPLRKLPAVAKTEQKGLGFQPHLFEIPVWSKAEFDSSSHQGYLAYCTALDIASSPADELQRYAYLQYIKQVNPDLHSRVIREMNSMVYPPERLAEEKWTDGECWSQVGDKHVNISWKQYVYVVELPAGPHYITGAMRTRLAYREPTMGHTNVYWISSEKQAENARLDFACLASRLPDGEAKENLLQMARACHVSIG